MHYQVNLGDGLYKFSQSTTALTPQQRDLQFATLIKIIPSTFTLFDSFYKLFSAAKSFT